ncbi:putative quinol monooxygenase [Cellvibrio sp. PSBB006]|uniref:putative quinol monooxygenase n=1 Tax=Cellvibrio sp. PSBB006 TaxID=1987723 RepID=UPI000B3B2684|nr:putative quinol monooxygenase [Cellvibrio sp. PSBB006]ARU26567.1 antibiotic biosynthesis monooxygenase [Cellvibrio sp. PSBB006]
MRLNMNLLKSITFLLILVFSAFTQSASEQLVRLSRLEIDPAQLDDYKKALKKEIEDSIRLEPGVLTLYAVFEKNRPNHLTILEIYADQEAYQAHIKSPHFLKYKVGTQAMVKHLELIDGDALIPNLGIKPAPAQDER